MSNVLDALRRSRLSSRLLAVLGVFLFTAILTVAGPSQGAAADKGQQKGTAVSDICGTADAPKIQTADDKKKKEGADKKKEEAEKKKHGSWIDKNIFKDDGKGEDKAAKQGVSDIYSSCANSPFYFSKAAAASSDIHQADHYLMFSRWGMDVSGAPSPNLDIKNNINISGMIGSAAVVIAGLVLSMTAFFVFAVGWLFSYVFSIDIIAPLTWLADDLFAHMGVKLLGLDGSKTSFLAAALLPAFVILLFMAIAGVVMSGIGGRSGGALLSALKRNAIRTCVALGFLMATVVASTTNHNEGEFAASGDKSKTSSVTDPMKASTNPDDWSMFSLGWTVMEAKKFVGFVNTQITNTFSEFTNAISTWEPADNAVRDQNGSCVAYTNGMHQIFRSTAFYQNNPANGDLMIDYDNLMGHLYYQPWAAANFGSNRGSANTWCRVAEADAGQSAGDQAFIARQAGLYSEFVGAGALENGTNTSKISVINSSSNPSMQMLPYVSSKNDIKAGDIEASLSAKDSPYISSEGEWKHGSVDSVALSNIFGPTFSTSKDGNAEKQSKDGAAFAKAFDGGDKSGVSNAPRQRGIVPMQNYFAACDWGIPTDGHTNPTVSLNPEWNGVMSADTGPTKMATILGGISKIPLVGGFIADTGQALWSGAQTVTNWITGNDKKDDKDPKKQGGFLTPDDCKNMVGVPNGFSNPKAPGGENADQLVKDVLDGLTNKDGNDKAGASSGKFNYVAADGFFGTGVGGYEVSSDFSVNNRTPNALDFHQMSSAEKPFTTIMYAILTAGIVFTVIKDFGFVILGAFVGQAVGGLALLALAFMLFLVLVPSFSDKIKQVAAVAFASVAASVTLTVMFQLLFLVIGILSVIMGLLLNTFGIGTNTGWFTALGWGIITFVALHIVKMIISKFTTLDLSSIRGQLKAGMMGTLDPVIERTAFESMGPLSGEFWRRTGPKPQQKKEFRTGDASDPEVGGATNDRSGGHHLLDDEGRRHATPDRTKHQNRHGHKGHHPLTDEEVLEGAGKKGAATEAAEAGALGVGELIPGVDVAETGFLAAWGLDKAAHSAKDHFRNMNFGHAKDAITGLDYRGMKNDFLTRKKANAGAWTHDLLGSTKTNVSNFFGFSDKPHTEEELANNFGLDRDKFGTVNPNTMEVFGDDGKLNGYYDKSKQQFVPADSKTGEINGKFVPNPDPASAEMGHAEPKLGEGAGSSDMRETARAFTENVSPEQNPSVSKRDEAGIPNLDGENAREFARSVPGLMSSPKGQMNNSIPGEHAAEAALGATAAATGLDLAERPGEQQVTGTTPANQQGLGTPVEPNVAVGSTAAPTAGLEGDTNSPRESTDAGLAAGTMLPGATGSPAAGVAGVADAPRESADAGLAGTAAGAGLAGAAGATAFGAAQAENRAADDIEGMRRDEQSRDMTNGSQYQINMAQSIQQAIDSSALRGLVERSSTYQEGLLSNSVQMNEILKLGSIANNMDQNSGLSFTPEQLSQITPEVVAAARTGAQQGVSGAASAMQQGSAGVIPQEAANTLSEMPVQMPTPAVETVAPVVDLSAFSHKVDEANNDLLNRLSGYDINTNSDDVARSVSELSDRHSELLEGVAGASAAALALAGARHMAHGGEGSREDARLSDLGNRIDALENGVGSLADTQAKINTEHSDAINSLGDLSEVQGRINDDNIAAHQAQDDINFQNAVQHQDAANRLEDLGDSQAMLSNSFRDYTASQSDIDRQFAGMVEHLEKERSAPSPFDKVMFGQLQELRDHTDAVSESQQRVIRDIVETARVTGRTNEFVTRDMLDQMDTLQHNIERVGYENAMQNVEMRDEMRDILTEVSRRANIATDSLTRGMESSNSGKKTLADHASEMYDRLANMIGGRDKED